VGRSPARLEQLNRDPEWEIGLKLARGSLENRHSGGAGQITRDRQQSRFAPSRRGLDHDRATGAGGGPMQRIIDRRQLNFALDQRPPKPEIATPTAYGGPSRHSRVTRQIDRPKSGA
jgi:hypothetical protein